MNDDYKGGRRTVVNGHRCDLNRYMLLDLSYWAETTRPICSTYHGHHSVHEDGARPRVLDVQQKRGELSGFIFPWFSQRLRHDVPSSLHSDGDSLGGGWLDLLGAPSTKHAVLVLYGANTRDPHYQRTILFLSLRTDAIFRQIF